MQPRLYVGCLWLLSAAPRRARGHPGAEGGGNPAARQAGVVDRARGMRLHELPHRPIRKPGRTGRRVTAHRRRAAPLPVSRSEEHTSELQSLMRISYAVFCLKKTKHKTNHT